MRSHSILVGIACLHAFACGLLSPARAEPARDLAVLFSDLCVETGLSVAGLTTAFSRVTEGETPFEGLVTDREQIYSREMRIGDLDVVIQAVAPAGSTTFRNCRVSGEFETAAAVETYLIAMYPDARRTVATVERIPVGNNQLFSISTLWLTPRPSIGAVNLTIEVLGKRHKASITAVPEK